MARLSLTEKVGVSLVAAPCFWLASWATWHYTRNWVPLDIPISRARGHVRSPEFKINFEGYYVIYLEAHYGPAFQPSLSATPVLWALRNDRNVLARGESPATEIGEGQTQREVGRFHVGRGIYVFDLDVPNHLKALNANEPSLEIDEVGGGYNASIEQGYYALLGVYGGVPVGLSLLILAADARRREKWYGLLRQWALTQPGPLPGTTIAGAPLKVGPWRRPKQVAARTFSVAGRFNLNRHILSIVQLLMLLWAVLAVCVRCWSGLHPMDSRSAPSGRVSHSSPPPASNRCAFAPSQETCRTIGLQYAASRPVPRSSIPPTSPRSSAARFQSVRPTRPSTSRAIRTSSTRASPGRSTPSQPTESK